MSRPTADIHWSTTATYPVTGSSYDSTPTTAEPGSGEKDVGWDPGQKPTAQKMNWWMWAVYLWITWLTSEHDALMAEHEIFVPVPEFASASTDFSGTSKIVAMPPLPVGAKITTMAVVMKGDGTGTSDFELGQYALTGAFNNLGTSTPTVESGASYHTTAADTFNYTIVSGDALVLIWTALTTQHLRGFVVKYLPA